ncbi:hypothetical protein EV201_0398 [Ancylomarina subtilis]|uniref:Lipocalin-like protein n=1 Tax=Ancylomarina subtilis TaxID=1639035 RepID=A0A4Q7VI38_9BACT|nr:hypothetical protein [Ancylomarina subtilis]RZT95773.1 hypothetical protein EV201_0398 [Ancylomarina subtilis]
MRWLTVVLMMCLVFSVNSCKNDDDDNGDNATPSHVGTWQLLDDGGLEKQVLVITESTFKMTASVYIEDEWVDFMIVEGSYSVDGNIFMLTITRLGVIADEETYEMVYFTPDDLEEWELLLEEEFEMEDHFEAKFVVSGNKLTIITDDNDDGVFDPIEEGETFTKL